ncbi:hypothetical protein ATL39_0918 [Sinobaca qinghaiensis]|uniref:Uncharacterized protein n=1 Tax=Sinobaca qinghaiensis TaxID=342944 RepID=A0A419V5I0_9BACL|nr:hypothetical protein ATL39_0918 [Sinobaca qinghaiensis]
MKITKEDVETLINQIGSLLNDDEECDEAG